MPLLGVKLWSVYPRLFAWPPARDRRARGRAAGVAVLVAAALFQVVSGVLNIARWYAPMPFFFTAGHYWVAWLAIGALLVHVGVKLPVVRRRARAGPRPSRAPDRPALTRRGLLAAVGARGRASITLATVGQTVAPLSALVRARAAPPRHRPAGAAGQQDRGRRRRARRGARPGVPAASSTGPARPRRASTSPTWPRCRSTPSDLPIACVEGWSADRAPGPACGCATWSRWSAPTRTAPRSTVESLQAGGPYRRSTVAAAALRDPLTLIALRLNGDALHLDHGYPARLIAPNRPGVLQTKWVGRITVRARR